ncbi:hypothetical protein [Streptomyces sp. ISL-94]|uniref:hypothetical protein n=1 Tax=Streptomyces sp. ISL-94 TaxID=2819190 RepID=UPI0020353D67|nr:hypothetical protein [Streptomyces sp. ISL-94]
MTPQSCVAAARGVPVTRTRIVCVTEASRGLVHTETSPVRTAEYSSTSTSAPPSMETPRMPWLGAVTPCSVTPVPTKLSVDVSPVTSL